jgi:hypothetical protein
MLRPPDPLRPSCPHCGEPIGTYEAVWRLAPTVDPERTSWLNLGRPLRAGESLWHADCAERDGVDGG